MPRPSIRRLRQCTLLLTTVLVWALPCAAQQTQPAATEPLTVTLSLWRVQLNAQAKEELVPAPAVKPGELVEYQAVYANTSDRPLSGVQATLPLPEGMAYEAQSAQPLPVQASSDGRRFGAEPLMREVRDKEGKSVSEPVPYAEYRALRWQIPLLEPGKTFTVKARARVVQATAAPVGKPLPEAATGKKAGS